MIIMDVLCGFATFLFILFLLGVFLLFSFLTGKMAERLGRDFWNWFGLSILFSAPLILICIGTLKEEKY